MTADTETPFRHSALFYRGSAEYVAGTVSFIEEGLAAGEPVAVAVPGDNLALIEDALGERAADVRFLDMTEAGRNPGRILPGVLFAFADRHDRPVRIVGEPVWPGRSEHEYPACAQHEALINHAFAVRSAAILCPYDVDGLGEVALADAEVTHPLVTDAHGTRESELYSPDDISALYNEPLQRPATAETLAFEVSDLSRARHFLLDHGRRLGLTGDRLDDLALAVAELCANSVVHGDGGGTLAVWREGTDVICEVRDRGRLADPLAGRVPAAPDQLGGRGLLMVNELVDLVRMHTAPEGTAVRVYVRA